MWDYEDEYRLVAEERQRLRPVMLETHASTLRLRPGALVGVVLGCLCDEARMREVLDSYALALQNIR
ncbi:protein of unknown function (plasmid) [Caballeronia sp. S22]